MSNVVKRWYKLQITKQANDAQERSSVDRDGKAKQADQLADLQWKNRNGGLSSKEYQRAKELISMFNERGKEYKTLNR